MQSDGPMGGAQTPSHIGRQTRVQPGEKTGFTNSGRLRLDHNVQHLSTPSFYRTVKFHGEKAEFLLNLMVKSEKIPEPAWKNGPMPF
jgi:hypothetical protein